VANAVRRRVGAGELAPSVGGAVVADLLSRGLRRYPHSALLERIWELCRSLTTRDAAYVALAETLDAPLPTTDAALARTTGHRARIEAFPG
jgi:predicted nucleic acid-binding protein